MYNFDPAEEQDDLLEQELLDHGREGSLAGPNAKVSWKALSSHELLYLWQLSYLESKILQIRPQDLNRKKQAGRNRRTCILNFTEIMYSFSPANLYQGTKNYITFF